MKNLCHSSAAKARLLTPRDARTGSANLALPFYYRKYRPTEFHVVKHGVLPALGAIAIIVPLYLAKPGQPTPYDWFPYAALIVVAVAAVYAFVLNGKDSDLADRVGSLVADE